MALPVNMAKLKLGLMQDGSAKGAGTGGPLRRTLDSGSKTDEQPATKPGRPVLTRGNSTNSVIVRNTISKPSSSQLLHSLAVSFHHYLRDVDAALVKKFQSAQGSPEANPYFDTFDETLHPLTAKVHDCIKHDRVDHHAVETWVSEIFRLGELQPECVVLSWAFFDRMRRHLGDRFVFCTHTWRRSILACMILASKIWEDMAVWNADFLDLIPQSDGRDLGRLEQMLLRALDFNIEFTASQYAQIYFELRAVAQGEKSHSHHCQMADDDTTVEEDVEKRLATRVAAFQEGLDAAATKEADE